MPKDFDAVTASLERARDADSASADNLHTVQAQIDAIARGDLATVLRSVADDVTLDICAPPEFPFTRAARGAEAFRAAIERNFAAVDEQRPVVRDVSRMETAWSCLDARRG